MMTLSIFDIRESRTVVDALRTAPFEFDIVDYDEDKSWIFFDPPTDFSIIAGDDCGGVYVILETETPDNGIFHMSSEAKASRIGNNLREALEHILTIPNWSDVANEDLNTMRNHLIDCSDSDNPDWTKARDHVGAELGLDLSTDFTERLHQSLAIGVTMKVLCIRLH